MAATPSSHREWWLVAMLVAAIGVVWTLRPKPQPEPATLKIERISEMEGVAESPAMSPTGKAVAFSVQRQIWMRVLSGGAPLQLTHDDADHAEPRWTPDSSALLYFAGGAIYEIAAAGGEPRRIVEASSGGDVSHDGQRVAFFRDNELYIALRNGSQPHRVTQARGFHPRWSQDDKWIAYQSEDALYIAPTPDGDAHEVFRSTAIKGLSWLSDGSGLVFAASVDNLVFNLRTVRRDGSGEKQLTFSDLSYVDPDVFGVGRVAASRLRVQSDIWQFSPAVTSELSVRDTRRVTVQTGQIQSPWLSADGKELVYVSDSGGHSNLWVIGIDGHGQRQVTFERDPTVGFSEPKWSPVSQQILYVRTRNGESALWLVNSDGTTPHLLVKGAHAHWSADGTSVSYANSASTCSKIAPEGGAETRVPCEGAGGSTVVQCVRFSQLQISPDRSRLEGMLSVRMSPLSSPEDVDLHRPRVFVLPQLTSSRDGKTTYAAVAEQNADIVLLDGLTLKR